MSKRLVVSNHAMKHVDVTQENSSFFVNIETMYQCIQACLNLDGVSPSVFRCTSTPMETGPIDTCVET